MNETVVDSDLPKTAWIPEPEPQCPARGWRLPIAWPDLGEHEMDLVRGALMDCQISGATEIVKKAERKFADCVGTQHAVACNSGGSALHLLMRALSYPPGSDIICPSFTMIATAAAISLAGHVPVFVDCEPEHLTLNPDRLAEVLTDRTRAVMVVHLYGHPADTEGIQEVINDSGKQIDLLEDAAEAHGAKVWTGNDHARGKMCGSLGRAAAFGFYGNKVLTCGEGGTVTTDDEALAARVRSMRGYCFDPRYHFWHTEIGHSMRMSGLAAALLSSQVDRAEELVASRQEKANWYAKHLREETVAAFTEANCRSCWWHYWVRCSRRAEVREKLAERGIETRPGFTPMHVQPCYQKSSFCNQQFSYSRTMPCPEAERAGREVLLLPTHCRVTEADVREICEVINWT